MDPTTSPTQNLTIPEPDTNLNLNPEATSEASPAASPEAGAATVPVDIPTVNPATAATPALNIPSADELLSGQAAANDASAQPATNEPQASSAQVFGIPEIDPSLIAATPEAGTGFDTSAMAGASEVPGGIETPTFGATDPLTMPTPPKAPDPVEEELKAPLKAAGPVPGSIGSAISVPPEDGARSPEIPQQMMQPMMPAGKTRKKTDKNTMILIGVVGALIIVSLVVVLVMQILGK